MSEIIGRTPESEERDEFGPLSVPTDTVGRVDIQINEQGHRVGTFYGGLDPESIGRPVPPPIHVDPFAQKHGIRAEPLIHISTVIQQAFPKINP